MPSQVYYPFDLSDGYNQITTTDGTSYTDIAHIYGTCTADMTLTFQSVDADNNVTQMSGNMFFKANSIIDIQPFPGGVSPGIIFQLLPGEYLVAVVNTGGLGTFNGLIYWV